jgi:UDP-N-acetylglucosamine--N-acetylmuramyl-(pentapeptide) pyrophosphoryl-undecaprenol N-acetylglucosamine transferase
MTTLWVGGEGGMEAGLVARAGLEFCTIPAAGVHGVGLRSLPGNIWKLLRGTLAARHVLRQFQPDVLLFTGGYLAVPMALAGWRIPSLLYVPDIEPGLALKALARFATRIALTTETSRQYFRKPDRLVVTGYPTRTELQASDLSSARSRLGLHADLPVLLVFGGSQGARSINRAVLAILPQLLAEMQVLHIGGKLDWAEIEASRSALPADLAKNYHAFDYLHEMGDALASADLVISRAGAATLGEYPLFGLPAILVPYPHAWRYQRVNAEYLVQHQAAILLKDENLQTDLLNTVREVLASPERLKNMQTAMKNLLQPDAAQNLADLVLDLARQTGELS